MQVQLTIFDLSGTTVEDAGQVPGAFLETMHARGYSLSPDFLQTVRGTSKRELIQTIVEAQKPHELATIDEIYSDFRERLSIRYSSGGIQKLPGTYKIFEWLNSHGVKIALNTGFDRMITEMIVETLEFDQKLIQAIVCADDVSKGRPAPDMIHRAMKLTGVNDPDHVANVGDTVLDLQAGHAAKVRWNIGVYSGAHSKEQLQAAPHSHILAGVADLPSVLR